MNELLDVTLEVLTVLEAVLVIAEYRPFGVIARLGQGLPGFRIRKPPFQKIQVRPGSLHKLHVGTAVFTDQSRHFFPECLRALIDFVPDGNSPVTAQGVPQNESKLRIGFGMIIIFPEGSCF